MAETTHTPGPWHPGGNGFIVYASNGYAICDVKTFHGRSDDDVANASLIAAAPELLAAAKLALHEMCNTTAPRGSFTDAVDALDAAIAKAEGRS